MNICNEEIRKMELKSFEEMHKNTFYKLDVMQQFGYNKPEKMQILEKENYQRMKILYKT